MSHSCKIAHIPTTVRISDLKTRMSNTSDDDYILDSGGLRGYYKNAESVIFDGFIISIFKGKDISFSINGRDYVAKKGDMLVLAPNMILEYHDIPEDNDTIRIITAIGLVMELPSPFDTDIISAARMKPLIRPDRKELEVILDIFSVIGKVYSEEDGEYRKEIIKSLTFGIIYKIGEIYSRVRGEMPQRDRLNDERLSDDFFRLLALHYRKDRTVKFYADKMALTPKYLSQAIRRITGKSVHEWVDDAIMLEIKNLLKTTDLTILQISEELNFCSPSSFIQFFRQHTGQTPFRYRHSESW